jgi:bisphosphoglycerate-dependent phosphoglycerate mutase
VEGLFQVKLVPKIYYTEWLSNVVLMKKSNGKRQMCVDYTNLNKACPKTYPVFLILTHWWIAQQDTNFYHSLTHTSATTKYLCLKETETKLLPYWNMSITSIM